MCVFIGFKQSLWCIKWRCAVGINCRRHERKKTIENGRFFCSTVTTKPLLHLTIKVEPEYSFIFTHKHFVEVGFSLSQHRHCPWNSIYSIVKFSIFIYTEKKCCWSTIRFIRRVKLLSYTHNRLQAALKRCIYAQNDVCAYIRDLCQVNWFYILFESVFACVLFPLVWNGWMHCVDKIKAIWSEYILFTVTKLRSHSHYAYTHRNWICNCKYTTVSRWKCFIQVQTQTIFIYR